MGEGLSKEKGQNLENIFSGGEMSDRIREFDWANTPLGAREKWDNVLSSTLSICLISRFPMAIYWGSEGFLLYNDAWRPILGDKHPWALGRAAREVWTEIWDTIAPLFESVFETGEATWVGDGLLPMQRFGYTEECYFDYTFNPIRGKSGKVEGILNVVQETTYRVLNDRRTKLLREVAVRSGSAQSVENACETAVAAMATDNADLPFALIYLLDENNAAARLAAATGLAEDHSARIAKISLADENDPWSFATALRAGKPTTIDDLTARFGEMPGGFWREPTTQAIALPIAVAGQENVSAMLIAGVNPRHLLDDEYQHFFELLAAHIATALTNAAAYSLEKRRAEKLAALDRAKTEFFSNVSHEFRTPLTLMLGNLEEVLSRDASIPEAEKEQLEMAHRNSLRLLKLVNNLLDFSRIEAGRARAHFEPTDLARLTAELAGNFRSGIEAAGLELKVDCPPLSQPIYVDREMWEKIVLNLVSNAFKFTFQGAIEVALTEKADTVELKVKDSGVGIPADQLQEIFKRFHRVRQTQGRTFEGTGIGLSLVKELVRQSGGDISVESKVDVGTTFTVEIPKGKEHLPPEQVTEETTAVSTTKIHAEAFLNEVYEGESDIENFKFQTSDSDDQTAKNEKQTAKILLADDNADMREYVRRLLKTAGYRVTAVSDGQAALDALQTAGDAGAPDLVLSDVMMPRLNGFELLETLRADERLKTIPFVMLSARAGEESKVEGLQAGADDYLVKPFSARELLARVQSNLEAARIRRAAAEKITQLLEKESEARHEAETLNNLAHTLAAQLDLETLVQQVTDAATKLTGAKFGAFFYNVINEQGESYMLYTLSGAPREKFEKFGLPRNTPIFEKTFRGTGVVRLDDVTKDPRYGKMSPHYGMPKGHLPVRSYLAVPVISRSGEVLGGLFFGHSETGVFKESHERLITALAAQAAIGIDNARLYGDAQREIERRKQAEDALRRAARMDAFCVALADAIRPLADPVEIQATASRMLGESLNADRVAYFEVRGTNFFVESDYANGVDALAGSYPIESFGEKLLSAYRAGQTSFSFDVAADSDLSAFEKMSYTAIQIGAYIGVPLIKNGKLVAGLAVHSSVPRQWKADEIALVEETAERTWASVERARAETALRESEKRFRTLFDLVPAAVYTTDREGMIQEFNQQTLELWGREPKKNDLDEKYCGSFKIFYPDGKPMSYETSPIARVLQGEKLESHKLEIIIERPDGSRKNVIPNPQPLKNERGEIIGAINCLYDITERKQTAEQIAGQNQTLEALAFGKDLTEILDLTSKNIENILPGSRASVLLSGADGTRLFCGSAKNLPAEYNAAIEGVMIGEGVGSCGTAAFRRQPVIVSDISQDELWKDYRELAAAHDLAACWSHPILAPNGALLGTFAIYFSKPRVPTRQELEMLESAARVAGIAIYRKQTEEALQKSEEEFRQLANAVPQIVWVADAHGRVIYVNKQWTEFSGLGVEETAQREIVAEVIYPEDREKVFGEWARALETGTTFEVEARMKEQKTGEYCWFLMRSEPTKDARGNVTQWFGTSTDITANKLAEQERERLLESERIARAEAEAANRAKDEFLAVLSHELRTPLNSIKGWVAILQNHNLNEEHRAQAIEVIARNVGSQKALIEDILDVSRIISGKMRIETERISFVSVLQNVLDAMQPIAEKKSLNLVSHVDASADEMDGDAFRLQQIISNLLNNAIKFTSEGGEIKVSLKRIGDTARLTVADTGIGIAPELLPRIFDRFQQADGTSKRKYGGLGLGLAIVKHLTELHGGRVSAASGGEDKGATFTVELPLVSQMIFPFAGNSKAKENNTSNAAATLANLKLLVVDDDEDALDMMRVILESRGANVVCVNSAQKALEKLAENKFDLLISDVGMAEMDGYDLIRAVRKNLGLTAEILPAIALSGYVSADDRARALMAGFQQHLGKPVDPIELPQKIKALVG